MEFSEVQRAVERLQAQGIPLEKITAPQVREILGTGSYTTITAHLRAIRGDTSAGEGEGGPSADEASSLARTANEASVDLVGQAAHALQQARKRLETLETEVASHEHALGTARQAVIDVVGAQLIAKECDWRSHLAADDPFIVGAGQRVEQAVAAYRQARAARERLAQAIAQARQSIAAGERAVTQARRDAYLQAHHPELVAQREALHRDNPANILDAMAPDFNVQCARWQAQVVELEGQIAEACREITTA